MGMTIKDPPASLQIYQLLQAIPGLSIRDVVEADPAILEQLWNVVVAIAKVRNAAGK